MFLRKVMQFFFCTHPLQICPYEVAGKKGRSKELGGVAAGVEVVDPQFILFYTQCSPLGFNPGTKTSSRPDGKARLIGKLLVLKFHVSFVCNLLMLIKDECVI